MELIELSRVDASVFKKNGHAMAAVSPRKWVYRPEGFKLAIRCCDGSFHAVNSEVTEVVRGGITHSEIKLAINALAPMDPIHGKRYVVFEEPQSHKVFLLGTVEEAVVMLAGA